MKKSVILAMMFFTVFAFAQDGKTQVPQITVTGEGKVKVTPDRAIVNVGVQNSGKDAKEVKTLNDETVDKVIKFLKKSGINPADYKTNNVSLNKNYDYEKKKYFFQANQSISITLKDLSKYDEIMMGLNDAGINSIQGVEFKSSKMEELERDARRKAMLNAKQKAEDYVTVLNQKIGKALLISDNSQVFYPQPMYKNSMMTMAADMAMPERETLAIGEIEINANVTVTFVLD
ncbi:SIMPL domain-containing protein [Flavobacterium capsici]|uniref:SIMPL domain-containing protein n=1 Tax=Flavobacterium capsici TaxID=3075618 RepID=A0AA96EXP1_9FLAO|nr:MULTISPECIES: SIMPL domain-containing protein [unclassified Flavobacterium]WNM20394.1 SIMPL domain-containing protein [Flavobacterium sp. PMR2A8]WNM21783.1 SIMPL domain-containing protein [Flavobacterium sp. PMTSA4]